MVTGSIREARRRRILEGGSDRLALITGRTSSQSSTSQDFDFSGFSSPLVSENQDFNLSVFHDEEDKCSHFTMTKSNLALESNPIGASANGSRAEVLLNNTVASYTPATYPAMEVEARPDPPGALHGSPNPSPHIHHPSFLKVNLRELFTYEQITTAVAATEQIRMFCSVTLAFLVVLSCMGFPIVSSWLIGSIIQFCPLYLVLLTNMALIFEHLVSEKQKETGIDNEAGKSLAADGWAEEAGKTIEMAFMSQSVIGALFMDCSVYGIIAVCGLSVA